ncbi:MAG TPA: ParB/RepB/Spo0J family partition protein [Thermodesulfobacteriota bacterium]|nr:ParB/RepB/Spo0J family partition protein [Thermodesulfobacteriota bacterium]HNU71831.1 ParB/RepB/Spo0J family partition protein [Thermodesulfobacteriota bacterium]
MVSAKAKTKFEKYEIVEVTRDQLKNAPYNPRVIHPKNQKKLRDNIKRVGLVEPIVWNRRTGNIVSGHQRVAILDSLEKRMDYTLSVAMVDLDEKTEKEQNVFMNNPETQGGFDIEKLEVLFESDQVDRELAGFDLADQMQIFGTEQVDESEILELGNKLHAAIEQMAKVKQRSEDRDGPDFYLVAVFRNNADRTAFMELLGLEDNKYVNGEFLRDVVQKNLPGSITKVASA